jgi:membrane carboxypeptidase/penicillin-binding protein PbpC
VGFTNDVTIAVWVGFDNADSRQTLGIGFTGSRVALPIFTDIVEASWTHFAGKTALRPPSDGVRPYLMAAPINVKTGDRLHVDPKNPKLDGASYEFFRLSERTRHFADTQFIAETRPCDPIRGSLLGGSNVCQDPPRKTLIQSAKSLRRLWRGEANVADEAVQ